MHSKHVENVHVATATDSRHERLTVTGRMKYDSDDGTLHYYAACPADRRASFSGSGMPFADKEQAMYGTPNAGRVRMSGADGGFQVQLLRPNAYYVGLGTRYVPPTLHLWYVRGGQKRTAFIRLDDGIPFRTLTYQTVPSNGRARQDATFYAAAPTLVRSQEDILRASAYPEDRKTTPANFWGTKPPV